MYDRIKIYTSKDGQQNRVYFYCPGCKTLHAITTKGDNAWGWNARFDLPTFAPSIMYEGGTNHQCHSYITNGKIAFLHDSHHELRGKEVDLPNWEDWSNENVS